MAKDRATIGAVVDRLIQKGLVARSENWRDRRARILRLTPKGEDLVAVLTPLVEGFQAEILANLDEEERRRFVSLAAKVTASYPSSRRNRTT